MRPRRQGLRQPPPPPVLANGLAEVQMARVMANIPMPKYSGNPEQLDKFERTWDKYVNDSTMGCSDAQRQRFCSDWVRWWVMDGSDDRGRLCACKHESFSNKKRHMCRLRKGDLSGEEAMCSLMMPLCLLSTCLRHGSRGRAQRPN